MNFNINFQCISPGQLNRFVEIQNQYQHKSCKRFLWFIQCFVFRQITLRFMLICASSRFCPFFFGCSFNSLGERDKNSAQWKRFQKAIWYLVCCELMRLKYPAVCSFRKDRTFRWIIPTLQIKQIFWNICYKCHHRFPTTWQSASTVSFSFFRQVKFLNSNDLYLASNFRYNFVPFEVFLLIYWMWSVNGFA